MTDKSDINIQSEQASLENTFSISNLEFDKVIQKLEDFAYSSIGKSLVRSLVPIRIPWKIMFHQTETSESRDFINREAVLPSFVNLIDVRTHVKRAIIGSTLIIEKLWDIACVIRAVRQTKEIFSRTIGSYPMLGEYTRKLIVFSEMERFLFKALEDEQIIADHATAELKKHRHNLREQNYRIQERSKNLARKFADKNMLTDSTFTIRNNRYVLPFSSGAMGRERVIIQSTSESGLTFYGEPIELVEMNNELQKAIQQVRNEEEKILQMLSAGVGEIGEMLLPSIEICGYLDFIFAKGYLSKDMKGVQPVFNPEIIKLDSVRHPLLKKDIVVPIDIEFGGSKKGLILTGPNAGGKTVSLKTLGLSALMAQAGLHIPVNDKSKLPIFSSVLAEIGDAQSIDLDLSSFGAHVEFLKRIIKSVEEDFDHNIDNSNEWIEKYKNWSTTAKEVTKEYDDDDSTFNQYDILMNPDIQSRFSSLFEYKGKIKPLILLDEIGRSTDPQEGSAIALSLIDRLVKNESFFALTTHLPALKNLVIADNSPVTGASMGFDLEKLETTYKIEKNTIGASYGIVIAEKMGLHASILDGAKSKLKDRYELLEINIPKLESKKLELESYVNQWEKKKKNALKEELRELALLILLKKMGMGYLIGSIDKADDLLKDTIIKTDRLIGLAKSGIKVKKEIQQSRNEFSDLRSEIENAITKLQRFGEAKDSLQSKGSTYQITQGQRVWVSIFNREGIVDQIKKDGKRIVVLFDGKKLEIDSSQATPIDEPSKKKKKIRININLSKAKPTPLWLDLHGERVESALEKVDKFLHDAFLEGRDSVNIVHGIGTGTLRKAIRELLRKHPLVEFFRDGSAEEGSIGSTVVYFKQR